MGNVTSIERTIARAGDVTVANQTLSTTQTIESASASKWPRRHSRRHRRRHLLSRRRGRQTRDGELTYDYDVNGNPAQIGYPGSVSAAYAYDFADRPVSLSVTTPSGTVPVASGATYLPSGPLQSLTLGNGTSEARTFTPLHFPEAITWEGSPARSWDYTTDAMGNVTAIERTIACAGDVTVANQTLSTTQTVESCAGLEVGPDVTLTDTADVTFRAAGGVSFDTGFAVQLGARMSVEPGATIDPPDLRLFDYQDGPYFLTRGDGPWGERDWDYDRIGNRLSETRERSTSPAVDTYAYLANGSGGDTAILTQIQLTPTGTADYAWDAAGNLDTLTRGANHLDFTSDDASRLAGIDRGDGMTVFNSAVFHYDGRSFLRRAEDPATGASVEPLYSSAGLLQALLEHDSPTGPDHRHTVFYLAGRPVAQLTQDAGGESWEYLTTDHLGAPLMAADEAGALTWSGGFEPFGQDPAADTPGSALAAGVFLRFPGQWETDLWKDASLGTGGLYYNLHRWYESGTGKYTRPDPMGLIGADRGGLFGARHLYAYARGNPTFFIDYLGLRVVIENPDTAKTYNQFKKCFLLFKVITDVFENDTWTRYGPDRTWTVKDPDYQPPTCNTGGKQSDPRTIWVPPGETCKRTMRCLFHEFYETWLIEFGGIKQSGPAGPAHDQAKSGEDWIPFDRCCPCPLPGTEQ